MQNDGGNNMAHILAASFSALVAAAAVRYRKRRSALTLRDQSIIPFLDRKESGRARNLEKFSNYVARQMGFVEASECPQLCKLATEYLRKSKGCEESIYAFFSDEAEAESLCVNLIQELDKCILSYFAFHWTHASGFITQVLREEAEKKTKLKDLVMAATRKQRFDRVSKNLKVTRVIATLVEEMKVIGSTSSHCTEVMAPVAHCDRSPVLLLMGGGMGAGKSTVLKDILKEPFWAGAEAKAVVVEADAFKESDVIYKAISSMGHHDDILETAELVHQSSTDAASSLLVTALNEGRDVIMDGTLSWEPFVEQMVSMTRNIHKQRYRMGVGYKVAENGTITESYWEVEKEQQAVNRKPYRIELVGVVCDAYLAVVRGIRRAIIMGRAVRVNSQLKSHKRFAHAFPRYCQLVDNARLYCTNGIGTPPKLMAWKDGDNSLLVDPEEIKHLKLVSSLNAGAESIYELYPEPSPIDSPGSVWADIVMSPSRPSIQQHLRACISKIEHSPAFANILTS